MSQHSVIDEKVVKMSLDNGEFNSAIDKSIKSIEKLENKLKFEDASDGFDQLTKDANKVDLSHIEKALDSINNKFKLMEAIGTMTLYRIANKAIDVGFKITKALTIQTPLDGLREYELKMGSIQTILANTRKQGTKLKDVTETLDELNHYADKTVYVFSDMTRAISQFTTAGVSLNQATTAIKGMSNLAAAVGADNATLSRVNYQVSQALNTGVFRLVDWRSLEYSSGMGGQIMQDAIKETAREFGVNVDAMIAKHGSFRESLQEGWLTADIYLKTMEKFSDPKNYPQYAYMEEAATKVRSFKKLVETTMESIGSRWAGIFETIIGDFDEATALWSTLNQVINGPKSILTKIMDGLEGIIERWDSMGGRKSMLEGLVNVFATLWTWIRPVVYAFRDMQFLTSQGLIKASKNFSEITKGLQLTGEKARDVYKTFRAIFTVFELAGKVVKAGIYAISPVLDLVAYLLGKIFGVTGDLSEIILRLRDPLKELIDRAKEFVRTKVVWVVEAIKNFIDTIDFMAIKNAIAAIVPIIVVVIKLVIKLLGYAAPLINFIAKLIPKAIQIAQIAIGGLLLAIGGVVIGLGKVIEFIVNKVKDLIKFLTGVGDGAVAIVKDLTKVGDKAKGISGWIADSVAIGMNSADSKNTVKNAAAGMCETIEESIRDELQIHSLSPLFMGIGSWIPKSVVEGMTSVDTSESVTGLASSMAGKIVAVNTVAAKESGKAWETNFAPFAKKASDDETKNFTSNMKEHETALDRFCNFIASVAKRIKDILINFSQVSTKLFETFLTNLVDIVIAVAKGIIDKVWLVAQSIWKILAELKDYIFKKFNLNWNKILGWSILVVVVSVLSGIVSMIIGIFNMFKGITTAIGNIGNAIAGGGLLTGFMDTLVETLLGIGLVMAAIVALSAMDVDETKLWQTFIIIEVLMITVGALMILVPRLTSKTLVVDEGQKIVKNTVPIISAIGIICLAMVSLAKTIKGMEKDEVDNLFHILHLILGMVLVMTIISGIFSIFTKPKVSKGAKEASTTGVNSTNNMLSGIANMVAAIAMLFIGLAVSFRILDKVNWKNLERGTEILIGAGIFILVLMGIMVGLIAVLVHGKKDKVNSVFGRTLESSNKKENKKEIKKEISSESVSDPIKSVAKLIKSLGYIFLSLAISFRILGKVNWTEMNMGVGYMIGAVALISALLLVTIILVLTLKPSKKELKDASKSKNSGIDLIEGISGLFKGIAYIMAAMAIMFKIMSTINWNNMGGMALVYFAATIGMIIAIIAIIALLSYEVSRGHVAEGFKGAKFGKNTDKVISSFKDVIIGLSGLILSFSLLFIVMGLVDWNNADKGWDFFIWTLLTILGIMAMISAIIIFSKGKKDMSLEINGIMGALTTIIIAVVLMVIILSNKSIADTDKLEKLGGVFLGIAALIAVVSASVMLMSLLIKDKSKFFSIIGILAVLTLFILGLLSGISLIFKALDGIDLSKITNLGDVLLSLGGFLATVVGVVALVAGIFAVITTKLNPLVGGVAMAAFAGIVILLIVIIYSLASVVEAIAHVASAIGSYGKNGDDVKDYIEKFSEGLKSFFNVVGIGNAITMLIIAPALIKFAKALSIFSRIDGDKAGNAIIKISEALNGFAEQIVTNLDAWQAFVLVLWESVIPLTVLTLAIGLASFGIAHLIFVLGLLAIVLALVFGATDSESFSNMLSEAFSTDNVIKAAEGLGEILGKAAAAVIGGALIGLPKGISNWLVDLANPEGKTIRKMEQEEWREYQNSMGRGESGNRWGLERYDNDNKLYRRIDYNNTGYLTRVYKDTEEDLRELESLLDASDAYLESLNPSTAGGLSADEIRTSAKMAITMLTSQMADEYTLEAGQFDKKYFADSLGVEKYSEFISDNEKFHDAVNNRIDAIHSTLEGIEQAILKKFGYLSPKLTDTFAGKILNEIGFKYYESGYSTAEYYKNKNGDNEQGSVPSVNQGVVIGSPKIGVAVETDPRYRAPTKNGGYASIGNGKLQTLDVVDDINDHIISQVMATDYESIGNWIFISIASGMDKSKDALCETTKNMAKSVEDTIRNTLQIHSLSPLLEAIGEWIPESLLQGIQNIDLSGGITGIAQSIWGLLKSLFGKLTDWIKETFPELWSWISRFFDLGGSFDANTAIATNYTMYDSLEKRLLYDQRLQNDINAAAEGLEGEEAEAAKAAKIAELREKLWNDYLDNSIYGEYDVDDVYKSLSEFFDNGLGGGLDSLGDISTGLASGANSAFDSAMGTNDKAGNTTNNEITFNQYNYSPEPVDRMEIYQQTRRQLESYRMYMGSYV